MCTNNLTDDETFSLWDGLDFILQLIQSKIDLLIILDQLCLSVRSTVLAIGISVKSHIDTHLDAVSFMQNNLQELEKQVVIIAHL